MRISTKGRGIIRAQQGAVARPNPKENYKLPEDQRYQAQTRGMKDFAIEWYKERAKQPKYQSQVNESNLANITDQINRAEYVEPSKFYSNPNVYKGKVGNVTQAAQVAMRQNKGAAYPAGLQYTYNAPSFPFSGTLDYQGATFFDRNFHFNLPTDLTNVSKLLFTGYFSTYRVTVDADSVTNNAVCQSGVTTEIPINQAYIGGDTANISINVII